MEYRYRDASEMKDSGAEWIGKIPKDWKCKKLKYIAYCEDGKRIPLSSEERGKRKGNIPYWGANSIIDYVDDYLIDYEVVLIGEDGAPFFDKIKPVAFYSNEKIWPNNHVHILKPINEMNAKFLVNSLNIVDYKNYIKGSTRDKLTQFDMNNIIIQMPNNKNEQEKIVDFLDKKTLQFDSIISKKEVLIEKLEEAKKSLISEVVTGKVKVVKSSDGYDLVKRNSDEMKDSGFEWLGEIPKDWEVKKFKHIFDFEKGLSITKANLEESGIPCINYGEIHSKYNFEIKPSKHKLKYVNKEYLNTNSNSLLKYGDFVFCDTSEDLTGCGNFTYLNENEKVFAGYHTIIARANKQIDYRYMAYLFTSDDWRIQIRSRVSGVKVFSITQTILKSTKVVLPSILEQENISGYLDMKCNGIDFIINKTKQQIEKLKGAKQSLISEVVTGKIEILD